MGVSALVGMPFQENPITGEEVEQCLGYSMWTDISKDIYKNWIYKKTGMVNNENEDENDEQDQIDNEDLIPEGVMCTETFLHADEMGRIINGAEVVPNSWNWYAYFGGCGGTILSREWIVTAAHCDFIQKGSDVYLGYHDNQQTENLQTVKVLEVISHKGYNPQNPKYPDSSSNDIALVRVEPITFDGKTVNPACIQKDIEMFEGKRCFVGGMGILESTDEIDPWTGQPGGIETDSVQSTSVVIGGGACSEMNLSGLESLLCAGDNNNQVN